MAKPIQTGVVTVSDRAARGVYQDEGGPAVRAVAERYGWAVVANAVVPDEVGEIQRALQDLVAQGCRLILTTGGTGIGPRDVTPEAVLSMARCELPGFGEVMRRESLKITPNAVASRCLAAVIEQSLVVCLPGRPKAAVECLNFVAEAIPHCLEMLAGDNNSHPSPNC